MSPHQTWILANTPSDLLIASAMFHHVKLQSTALCGIILKLISSMPDLPVEKNLGQGRQPQQSCPCAHSEADIGDQFGDE